MSDGHNSHNKKNESRKSLMSLTLKDDPRFYSSIYKNYMHDNSSENIYEIHEESKRVALINYFKDESKLDPVFFFEIIKLITDEFEIIKVKHLNKLELRYEKIFNDIYCKHIGIKSDFEYESLMKKWNLIEEEFLSKELENDADNLVMYKVLQKNKKFRIWDNIKKLLKNSESQEVIEASKQNNLKSHYEAKIEDYKKLLETFSEKNMKLNNMNKILEMTLKDKNSEIEILKERKNDTDFDGFRKEEKKYNLSSMRNSNMFYISTSNEKSFAKCTGDCFIF